jgi:hypothetical protein
MTEETRNPAVSSPRGILLAIGASAILGWYLILGLLFSIQDLDATIATETKQPVAQVRDTSRNTYYIQRIQRCPDLFGYRGRKGCNRIVGKGLGSVYIVVANAKPCRLSSLGGCSFAGNWFKSKSATCVLTIQ